jgi:Spy/CpxP family protein refolding chaperone
MSKKILQKGLLLAAGMLMVSGSSVVARAAAETQDAGQTQTAPAPAMHRGAGPELNLSDDQKAQMKKIREGAKSQIEAVNNDGSLSAEQKQAKIQAIHRGSHKQVEQMLTPEQRQTMKAWRQSHRGEKPEDAPPASN